MTYNVNHTRAPAATVAADIDAVAAEELSAAGTLPFGAFVDPGALVAFGAYEKV